MDYTSKLQATRSSSAGGGGGGGGRTPTPTEEYHPPPTTSILQQTSSYEYWPNNLPLHHHHHHHHHQVVLPPPQISSSSASSSHHHIRHPQEHHVPPSSTSDLDYQLIGDHHHHQQLLLAPGNNHSNMFMHDVHEAADQEDLDAAAPPDQDQDDELGAMKEMVYKIAAMQPVDIDPATIRKPKRRNVRISEDPQSVAARHRRERISEKIRILQRLVPGGTKMDTASMLDEAIRYVKFLKRQIRLLQSTPGK